MTDPKGLTAAAPPHGPAKDQLPPVLLDPTRLRFRHRPGGNLQLEVQDDCCYLSVRATRCFPFSDPRHYIAIIYGKNEEVGALKGLRKLDAESRRLVEEDLERRYFIPVITRVVAAREESGVSYWEVETSRGPREFVVRGMRDSLTELEEHRMLLTDVDGNRFEIPDYTQLGGRVFLLLDRHL